jgi:hypothetical protein
VETGASSKSEQFGGFKKLVHFLLLESVEAVAFYKLRKV